LSNKSVEKMAKIAYLECPTGIAGDMCLGALVDAGVPLAYLIEQLGLLGIADEFRLRAERVHRQGQQATKVYVDLTKNVSEEGQGSRITPKGTHPDSHNSGHSHDSEQIHAHSHAHAHSLPAGHQAHEPQSSRNLPEIERLIQAAQLPKRAESWSLAVFRQLAEAEGSVHGISPSQVHFHEVGAVDAIVDIVGTCLGLDWLDIEALYCSALPTGGGTVWAAHGRLPVPTPAVLRLWEMRQVPLYSNGIARELVTPTGAAIATALASAFGSPPSLLLQRVGLGAGSQDLPIPNILRLWIGESDLSSSDSSRLKRQKPAGNQAVQPSLAALATPTDSAKSQISALPQETIAVLETQIDDLNPQAIGYVFEKLFAAGALDVYTQAIGMKKSRPGILLTVVCSPEQVEACQIELFRETTTLGIRQLTQQRTVLEREIQFVQTRYGQVRLKIARWGSRGAIANVQPEYEDCAQLARSNGLAWQEMHHLALQTWHENQSLTP
jgi:pyridinium-3,5-bisthiocarboxylic acid mononucleotide nickel chelatase